MFKKTFVLERSVKTGIYTEGREWNPHEPSIFLGINAEKFHDGIAKYTNVASNAIESAYDATKQFISKRWYMIAVPIVFSASLGMYGLLMSSKPDVEVQEAANKKRKKNMLDYFMKYKNQAEKSFGEFTSGDFNGSLDDKVNTQEATK